MFDLFDIDNKKEIKGYHWRVSQPSHIVCIIHGIGEYMTRYDRIANSFNKNGVSVLGMDLRGHGLSSGKIGHCAPRRDVLADVDSLICYAQKYYENVPIILYGHSMGGNIVLDYKERGKLNSIPKGYIISSPWVSLVRPVPAILFNAVKFLSKIFPKATISASIDAKNLGNPDVIRNCTKQELVHNRISLLTAYEGFEIGNNLAKGQHVGNNHAANIPMLLMHGTEDKICNIKGSEDIAMLNKKNCTFIQWEGYYHEIHNGNSSKDGSAVIEKMIDWILNLY